MMTHEQIASEVERLGYEYAEGMMDTTYDSDMFVENYGVPLNNEVYSKVSFDDLFDWITASGDAFPEQVWSWAHEYEWISRDGTVKCRDENGNIIEGTGNDFISDFDAGVARFLKEHGCVQRQRGQGDGDGTPNP